MDGVDGVDFVDGVDGGRWGREWRSGAQCPPLSLCKNRLRLFFSSFRAFPVIPGFFSSFRAFFSVIPGLFPVIPAKAGIPLTLATSALQRSAKRALYTLDSRPCSSQGQALRGNGKEGDRNDEVGHRNGGGASREAVAASPPRRPCGGGLGLVLLALLAAGAASCGGGRSIPIPFLYRIEIQLGNLIEQKVLDRLQPGMSRQEVREAMGTALLADPFHGDRWHYVYYLRKDGSERSKRHIVLHFEDDRLVAVGGDVKPGSGNRGEEEKDGRRAVRIPEDPDRELPEEEQPPPRGTDHIGQELEAGPDLGPDSGSDIVLESEEAIVEAEKEAEKEKQAKQEKTREEEE